MKTHPLPTELATALLGPLTTQDSALLDLIVDAVQQEIFAQLRQDVERTDCDEAISLATVLFAVSAMRQLKDSGVSDFTAGTLQVRLRDDHSVYADMANRLLAPFRTDAFAFRGVIG